ncbi:MAG: hypothetical protein GY856_44380 [bacterium]|nr:hypothetical protein [bacterium]
MPKLIKRSTIFILLPAIAFAWGFFSHRNKIFPFELLKSTARVFLARPPEVVRRSVPSETPDPRDIQSLLALPYIAATFDPNSQDRGVLIDNPEKTFRGLSFYGSQTQNKAYLIDMEGIVLHEWSRATRIWDHVSLLPNGDVIVLIENEMLFRLDSRSRHLWTYKERVHHDLSVNDEGRIFVLTREVGTIPRIHSTRSTLADAVIILSADGIEMDRISILDVILRSPYASLLPSVSHLRPDEEAHLQLDILHTNHIEVFDGSLAHRSPLFAKNNILFSSMVLNAIAIIGYEERALLWLWGPNNMVGVHHPSLLENGNILLFSNGREKSRILEIDPLTNAVVWVYESEDFYSRTRGSCQRLPNGNTLITESDKGYILEVTHDGEIVWKFANPDVNAHGERAAVWRMTRFQPTDLPFILPRLKNVAQ